MAECAGRLLLREEGEEGCWTSHVVEQGADLSLGVRFAEVVAEPEVEAGEGPSRKSCLRSARRLLLLMLEASKRVEVLTAPQVCLIQTAEMSLALSLHDCCQD